MLLILWGNNIYTLNKKEQIFKYSLGLHWVVGLQITFPEFSTNN